MASGLEDCSELWRKEEGQRVHVQCLMFLKEWTQHVSLVPPHTLGWAVPLNIAYSMVAVASGKGPHSCGTESLRHFK